MNISILLSSFIKTEGSVKRLRAFVKCYLVEASKLQTVGWITKEYIDIMEKMEKKIEMLTPNVILEQACKNEP